MRSKKRKSIFRRRRELAACAGGEIHTMNFYRAIVNKVNPK